jgi:hypothetical protein
LNQQAAIEIHIPGAVHGDGAADSRGNAGDHPGGVQLEEESSLNRMLESDVMPVVEPLVKYTLPEESCASRCVY